MSEVYTVQEVAQNYKVNERTVRNWIEKEGLKAIRIGKRGYRIEKEDLDKFIEQRKQPPIDADKDD